MSDDELELVSGSGNLWQDSGFADAEIRQAKADLAAARTERNYRPRKLASGPRSQPLIFPACAMLISAASRSIV